jgi:hypothetical protein
VSSELFAEDLIGELDMEWLEENAPFQTRASVSSVLIKH